MTDSVSPFAGRVAVVTGAGQGLGQAIARVLAGRGATVVATDLDEGKAMAVAADLRARGTETVAIRQDVGEEADWTHVMQACADRFGRVDVLVNNAGLIEIAPLPEMATEVFDRVMRVNVRGAFLGCKLVLPLMRATGGGAIVNVSSVAGIVANMPGSAAYSTSKGAVRLLTKAVAMDYVGFGIRVNSIHPGTVATPATQPYLDTPELRPLVLGRTPIARPADPIEIAKAVAFLASDDASYMTGAELVIDGGMTTC